MPIFIGGGQLLIKSASEQLGLSAFSELGKALGIEPRLMEQYARSYQDYGAALKVVSTQLEILDEELGHKQGHSPIHSMESRLKTPESILEKMERKGYEKSLKGLSQVMDIAGVRVICPYENDIYYLYDLIKASSSLSLIRERDYVKKPKSNGYRSLHLIVGATVNLSTGPRMVPVEIQIRSIAMDLWASLEHELRYKSDRKLTMMDEAKLSMCARALEAVDKQMQNLFITSGTDKATS